MTTRPTAELTLADRLSHLTPAQALRFLGREGRALLRAGGALEIRIDEQVRLDTDRLHLRLADAEVTVSVAPGERIGLAVHCSICARPCEHQGAVLALVLEEKTALGLAAPPRERVAAPDLSEAELVARAVAERLARARSERMTIRSADPRVPWTNYEVTSAASGRTHRVALRSLERGASYCSCPDFRKNTLGTCKHVLRVVGLVRRRFSPPALRRAPERAGFSLHVVYGEERSLQLAFPSRRLPPAVRAIAAPLAGRAIEDLDDLLARLRRLEALGEITTVHPDAEDLVRERRTRERLGMLAAAIRKDPAQHPLRQELLAVELLPYQLDGIAFAVGAGRAILADEMGLGKTIQGIGVAELLRREAGIERVLVICPASVKAQWRSEIARFSGLGVQLVLGSASDRVRLYREPVFFTVCNYEQVLRDFQAIETARFDLVIFDEAQRVKNWEAKTSRLVKALRSPFALALSGTPLENRLDELYSVVELVDERLLGPAFRFFHRHRVQSERGATLAYRELAALRERLAPVLLRRTRRQVQEDLPPRTTEVVRIAPTEAQARLHGSHMQTVAAITRKRFLTEMDLLRLRTALLMCRLAANGSALVDGQEPGHSSKLERLGELLEQLLAEPERKIVLFSEWTRMLDRVEPLLRRRRARFVRLDGSVPQRSRQSRVDAFQRDPAVRVFLSTNAGATGLNLQAADTVVNVDLPWNPAVLEQRIGRAHRMGQRRPVQVFLLVTESTIEENLLATLAAKHELASAVLDPDSDVDALDSLGSIEQLRNRLEVLLGARPEAPPEAPAVAGGDAPAAEQRARIARAGGALVAAAFSFLGEMLPRGTETGASVELARGIQERLAGCLEQDADGALQLRVTLPDRSALDALAGVLARAMTGPVPDA